MLQPWQGACILMLMWMCCKLCYHLLPIKNELMMAHCFLVERAGESLMAQQQDPGMAAALTRSLTQLMTSNGVQQSLDRANQRAFRANLRAFVAEARSIVRRR